MEQERYHYDNGNITLCERSVCSLEHHDLEEAFVLLRDDIIPTYYRPRHRKEVSA